MHGPQDHLFGERERLVVLRVVVQASNAALASVHLTEMENTDLVGTTRELGEGRLFLLDE